MRNLILFIITLWAQILISQDIKLELVKSGFRQPTDIASAGILGDTRLFIVEKRGIIQVLDMETNESTLFLDIISRVNATANERGLLGLCFHPLYGQNGYFYVHYTNAQGNSVIARYQKSIDDDNLADPQSEKIILSVPHPFNNHNAGDLEFGPNGYLYIGMGDGGSGGDPGNRSQNPKTLLGKMLRIDINTENEPYLIPENNPYFGQTDTLPEIWALGLRNPWRFSFDKAKNQLWIADVGQRDWEEINVVSATSSGLNYGWRCYEGNARFNFNGCNDEVGYTFPVHVYPNRFDVGCSVTGGFVYRGTQEEDLIGKYIYTDFCTGIFWGLSQDEMGVWKNETLGNFQTQEYATFGEDINGELYVAGLGNGELYKVKSTKSTSSEQPTLDLLNVHPNPVQDILTIQVDSHDKKELDIYILNIFGQMVLQSKVPYQHQIDINLSHLPSGFYLLNVNADKSGAKPFVKH